MKTYLVKITGNEESLIRLRKTLELSRDAWNMVSKLFFGSKELNIKVIHNICYHKTREAISELPSQLVIKAEQSVLATLRAIHTNKHNISAHPVKKKLSVQLDKRLYSIKGNIISVTAVNGKRIKLQASLYDRVKIAMMAGFGDPKLFERKGIFWLAIPCRTPTPPLQDTLCVGVDLGLKRAIFTSEGVAITRKQYNGLTRKLSFNARKLQIRKTQSSKRKLKKLSNRKRCISLHFTHSCVNSVLNTKADVIAVEWLRSLKLKDRGTNFNRRLAQWASGEFRRILEYKAQILGKRIVTVPPAFTSQRDFRGIQNGKRVGCRYYGSDGVVLDADHNAACNIAAIAVRRLNIPVSQVKLLDGQALVAGPNCFAVTRKTNVTVL